MVQGFFAKIGFHRQFSEKLKCCGHIGWKENLSEIIRGRIIY